MSSGANHLLNKVYAFSISILLLATSTLTAGVVDVGSDGAPVHMTADNISFDPDTKLYTAAGNVEITQGNRVMSADTVIFNKDTKEAVAKGRVIVIENGNIMSCESMTINMDSNLGRMENTSFFIQEGNFHIRGREILKTGEKDYTVKDAEFTSCDGESPSWSFHSTTAHVTIDEYVRSWNPTFNIKDVPVLYLPYIIVPIKRERQSGFLIPNVSYSDQDGLGIGNGYFWAISRNTDATIYLNYLSRKGVEEGLEYRYVLSKDTKGTFYGTYMEEWEGRDRWSVAFQHDQLFSPTFYNKTDINYVSDDSYYRKYGDFVEIRSQDRLESYVSFTKNRHNLSLVTQFRYYEDLVGNQDTTLQRLPEMTLTGLRQPVAAGSQFDYSLNSSAVNFYREEGTKGQRMDVNPRGFLTLNPGGYFTFVQELGLRETAYLADSDVRKEDGYSNREMYDLKSTASTSFVRVFRIDGESLMAVRHSIEPEVVYEYVPQVDQDDLPMFDQVDRIAKRNMITYSLSNRMAGKFLESGDNYHVRELAYLKVSQGYDINESKRDITTPGDERRPFKDVTVQARVTPLTNLSMISDAAIDSYEGYLNSLNASVQAGNARGDSLSVEYRYAKDQLEYVRGILSVKATNKLSLSYDSRYSIIESRYLENIYSADYRHQCWEIQFSYSERPEEKKIFAVINLSGMGTVARLKGGTPNQ